jgi:hypothetical protein
MPYDITVDDKIRAFWNGAGLPSPAQCELHPDTYKRKVFDPADIAWVAEAATHGGTHYDSVVVTAATTGSIVLTTPGVLIVDSGATAADRGPCVQTKQPWLTVATGKKYGVLTRQKVTDFLIYSQYFNGLAELVTAMHSSGDFVTKNFIGFGHEDSTSAADGDGCYFCNSGSDAADVTTNIGTLVEDTYAWVGFVCTGASSCRVFLNGVWYASTLKTKLPDVGTVLYPTWDCLGELTTNDPILSVSHFEARWEENRS